MQGAKDWNDDKMTDARIETLQHRLSSHYKNGRITTEVPSSYKLFTFVRDPLARVVSFYYSKIVRMRPYYYGNIIKKILERVNRVDPPDTAAEAKKLRLVPTFESLIKFIIKYPHETDNHYAPMCQLCQFCSHNYSFIGKLENTDKDFPKLIQFLGLNETIYPVHSYFTHNATQRTVIEHFSDVRKEDILKLQQKYQADYELLKYPLPETYLPQFRSAT